MKALFDQIDFLETPRSESPPPIKIQEQMDKRMAWYTKDAQELHPITRGAMLHVILLAIHP